MTDHERVLGPLLSTFKNKIASVEISHDQPIITVGKTDFHDFLSFLRFNEDLEFNMLLQAFAVDYQTEQDRFGVYYVLRSAKSNNRLTAKTRTDESGTETASDLWEAANWLEREMYDMFGIHFTNHPDLRRIYNVDDFDGYPLRKDFPVEGPDFDKPFTVELEKEKV